MKIIKGIVKDFLPTPVLHLLRQAGLGQIRFKGHFSQWQVAASQCSGYDDHAILNRVLASTLKVKSGSAAYERDSSIFSEIQYSWPLLSGLMRAAAINNNVLNVLDFGGSLGSTFFQNKKFFSELKDVLWNIVEQPHFVKAGVENIQDDTIRFYTTIDECLAENSPNVVILSSVLQYISRPMNLLEQLSGLEIETLIIDRTPYLKKGDRAIIKIQEVTDNLFVSKYPCHFFIEDELINIPRSHGYNLLESFDAIDKLSSEASWRGHILIK